MSSFRVRHPLSLAGRWTGSTRAARRTVLQWLLLIACVLALLPLGRAGAASLYVAGSGSTTKTGQSEFVRFTFLNLGAAPARLTGTLGVLPAGFTLASEAPGTWLQAPGEVATLSFQFHIARGTADGFHDITLAWSDAVSAEGGTAVARILLTPFDTYAPTLVVTPDPLVLVGSAPGLARGLAGCLTDDTNLVPWFVTECPFVYHTSIESAIAGAVGLPSVAPLTGPLDIPEGAPTPIPQTVTAPVGAGTAGLDLVTIEIDALTPAGWRRGAAWCRYVVAWFRPGPRLLPVRPRTWSQVKALYEARDPAPLPPR